MNRTDMERIVRTYSDMLLHLAFSRLQSEADAEDCVQDVFVKLWRIQPAFRDPEHEKAWLIRVTVNQAADLRRKKARQMLPLEEAAAVAAPVQDDLLSVVRALPDKYAVVLHLYYYEGYKVKEISKLLALPVSTVTTRLARGRDALGALLKGESDETE